MHGELVTATTSDLVRLHGLFSQASSSPRCEIDAAVVVHGLAGNFYSSRLLFHFAQTLLGLGVSVVLVNTRGHDSVNTTARSGRSVSLGAAYEDVAECRFDLTAWADFLVDRRYNSLLLFGHSLGAIKSLYAQAHMPHPNVKAIIGLSATRLSHQRLLESPGADKFKRWLGQAEQLVAAGNGDELMRVDFPFATWMSAAAYCEKYGPDDKFNWLNFIDRVQIPTLLLFGQLELDDNPAFDGLQHELERLQGSWNEITIDVVPGADHFYSARFDVTSDVISRWLTR